MYRITSSQVGGIGKHASPPHTITEKITTRLQNKYNPESSENRAVWKSDKKELRKPYSSRRVRGAEMQRHKER